MQWRARRRVITDKKQGLWHCPHARTSLQCGIGAIPLTTTSGFNFDGAVALVTGSGRGLGRMIVETLLAGGANVVLHDIDEKAPAAFGEAESLTALAKELSARGPGKVISVLGDISKEADVAAMVKKIETDLGPSTSW